MKKTITIRIEDDFLEVIDKLIKESNEMYSQSLNSFDCDGLRRFKRIRKYSDRSDFIESSLSEFCLNLYHELNDEILASEGWHEKVNSD